MRCKMGDAANMWGADHAGTVCHERCTRPEDPTMTQRLAMALAVLACALATVAVAETPPPELPGITAPDKTPDGCVSCHKGSSTLKKMLAGLDHRSIDGKVNVVPDDCKECHGKEEDTDTLAQIAHSMHYASGSRSEFVIKHDGSCLACHAMSTGDGAVTVKSGARNW